MNIYHDLLFQGGHIADAKLALTLAHAQNAAAAATIEVTPCTPRAFAQRLRWLFEELVLLGGRPVSTQHLDDIDEPFPTLHPCH